MGNLDFRNTVQNAGRIYYSHGQYGQVRFNKGVIEQNILTTITLSTHRLNAIKKTTVFRL